MCSLYPVSSSRFQYEIDVETFKGKPRKVSINSQEVVNFLSELNRMITSYTNHLSKKELNRLNELTDFQELSMGLTSLEEMELKHLEMIQKQAEVERQEEEEDQRQLALMYRLEEQTEFAKPNSLDFSFPLEAFNEALYKISVFRPEDGSAFRINRIQEILTKYQGIFDDCRQRYLRSMRIKNVEQSHKTLALEPDRKIGFPHETVILQKLNDLRDLVDRLSTSSFELTLPSITQSEFSFIVGSQSTILNLLARKSNETTHPLEAPASYPNQMKSTLSHEINELSLMETQDSRSDESELYARDVIKINGRLQNIYFVALFVIAQGLRDPITERMLNSDVVNSLATYFGLTNQQLVDIFISTKDQDRKDERAGLLVIQNRDPIAKQARKLFEQAIIDANEVDRANYLIGGLARISPI